MAQTLEHNQAVTTVAAVPVPTMDEDLDVIVKLDDEPNDVGGMSAAELKAAFDEAGNKIKAFINGELIPALLADGLTEEARMTAESERVANEQERVANEGIRVSAEAERNTAEEERQSAENVRVQDENIRVQSELSRVQAEQARADENTGIVATARQITADALTAKETVLAAMGSAHGVYIGSGEIPEGYDIQIDPNGQADKAVITAYDLAVENGFTGTVQAWLQSLVGEKGDQGDTGAQGIQGERGLKGEKGDKGEPGTGLETVLPLIPEEASSENQLADKAFVKNEVSTGAGVMISAPGTVSADGSAIIPEGKNDPTSMIIQYPDPYAGLLVSQYHRMNALYYSNPYNLYPGGPEYDDGAITIVYQKDGHCKMTGRRSATAVRAFFDSKSTGATPILVKANTPVYVRDMQIWYFPASEMPENLKSLTGGSFEYGISKTDWKASAPMVFTPTEDIYIVKAGLYIKMNVDYDDIYFPQLAIGYNSSEVKEEVYTDNWYYTLPAVQFDDEPNGEPTVTINYRENQVSVAREEITGEQEETTSYAYNNALIHRPQSGQTVSVYAINDPAYPLDWYWYTGDAVPFDIRYDETVTAVSFYQRHRKLLGIWTGETSFAAGSRSFLNMDGFRRFEIVFQYTDQASGATAKPYYLRETVEIGRPTCVQCLIGSGEAGFRRVTGISENTISFSNGYASSTGLSSSTDPSVLVPIEIWGIQ